MDISSLSTLISHLIHTLFQFYVLEVSKFSRWSLFAMQDRILLHLLRVILMQNKTAKRKLAAQKISIIGAIVNALMSILKITGGFLTGSAALVADGFHSLSDVATDVMVVFLIGISHKMPDEEHPWGHGRFETLGTVLLAIILLLVASFMTWDSLKLLFSGQVPPPPAWQALVIAAASILANELLFFYTLRVGKENQSNLIIANAWHHRTDSLSSIVVLIALAGTIMGVWWLDALAAVLVALLIAKIAIDLLLKSVAELVDTALPTERIEALEKAARSVEGVINVHHVRSRLMGGRCLLEMHLQVAPHTSASEGHYIGNNVCNALKEEFDDITYIIYHIDTYDDENIDESDLPMLDGRKKIEQLLDTTLAEQLDEIPAYQLRLFYSPRSLQMEVQLTPSGLLLLQQKQIDPRQLEKSLENAMKGSIKGLQRLSIWLPVN